MHSKGPFWRGTVIACFEMGAPEDETGGRVNQPPVDTILSRF